MIKQRSFVTGLALVAMLGLGGCGVAGADNSSKPAQMPASSSSMPGMTASGDAMASMIHIESGKYTNDVPVSAGSTVTVMNMDTATHSVTADDGSSFNVSVPHGAVVTFTAPMKAGTYAYHSDGNASMHGVLTVR